jgi:aminoglycoside phosphotransferase (APT) family kinase protein
MARNPDETAEVLRHWLIRQLNNPHITITDISVPKAGFSNETILAVANIGQPDGTVSARAFVARIQPTGHQLFTTPDAIRQASTIQALAPYVRVPTVWLTEASSDVLGAPFFLMDQVSGRVPSDVPSWHRSGWTKRLTEPECSTLHDNALGALVALHRVKPTNEMAFLSSSSSTLPTPSEALDRMVDQVHAMYRWCEPVRVHGASVIDAAMQHVLARRPEQPSFGVVWYDARVGNIMFDDRLEVASMFDWEGATLGPPEFDIAWWVMFDEYLCEAQGLARLPGVPDAEGTLRRYEELAGQPLSHIGYYQVMSGLVLALINSRLCDLLVRNGIVTAAVGAELVTRITDMTGRYLERANAAIDG